MSRLENGGGGEPSKYYRSSILFLIFKNDMKCHQPERAMDEVVSRCLFFHILVVNSQQDA